MVPLRSDVSHQLGQLLLSRYTMLAENCISCQIPLMKEPRSGSRLCVNCGSSTPEGQAQGPLQPTAAPPPVHAPSSGTEELDPRANPETFGPFAMSPAALGAPSEPVALPADGPVPRAAAAAPATQPDSATAADAGRPWRRRQQQRTGELEPADLIAQRMLQGWALLDQYCPRCSEVLIRNREGRVFCVRCDAYVALEQGHQQPQPGVPVPATPPLQAPSPAATDAVLQPYSEAVEVEVAGVVSAHAEPPALNSAKPLLLLRRTLLRKVGEVEAELSTTPVFQMSRIRELLGLTQEILSAMKSLRELRRDGS